MSVLFGCGARLPFYGSIIFTVLSDGAETQSLTLTQSGILAPGRSKCREWVEASVSLQ